MNTFLEDIYSQPDALAIVLDRFENEAFSSIQKAASMIASAQRVVLTSMGSAFYSLDPMAYALSRLHPNTHLVETSELLRQPFFPQTLYVIMSRSGESGEIVELSNLLHARGDPLLVITMTPTSSLARHASLVVDDPSPYDGFICTKAYSSLAMIGLFIVSCLEKTLDRDLIGALRSGLGWMETGKHAMLERLGKMDWLGPGLTFLSRRAGLGLARSGALWMEEAARVRSSYSSIDFFLHGPVEQVDEQFHGVWIDLMPDALSRKQRQSVFAKGGRWITISPESDDDRKFLVPDFGLPEAYRVILAAMIVQMIAYQSATNAGLNPGEMRYLNWVVK